MITEVIKSEVPKIYRVTSVEAEAIRLQGRAARMGVNIPDDMAMRAGEILTAKAKSK